MTRYVQQRNVVYELFVNGKYKGLWTEGDGGELSADKVQYGDGPVAAGVPTREDVKLTRPFSEGDVALEDELEAILESGGGDVLLLRSMAGDDGLPLGEPRKLTGTLLAVAGPQSNKTASERGMFNVTVGVNTKASS